MTTVRKRPAPPRCLICSDTGWKPVALPTGRKEVVRCDCHIANRTFRLLKQARIPERYRHCTLADFDTSFPGADPSLAAARLAAGRLVEEYPLEKAGLLITGDIGTGKTHLAVAIIQELTQSKGVSCLFYDYRELLREILQSYQPSVESTEREILRPVMDVDVLVLDELGAVNISHTEWVWDTVSYILNHRYNEKKTTIVTTNFPDEPARETLNEQRRKRLGISRQQESDETRSQPKESPITLGDRITDRMRSRLHEMCRAVVITGKDFRMGPGSVRRRIYSNIPPQ